MTGKRPSARRVLASKNVQVTGVDVSALIRSTARQMWEKAEAGTKKREEADRLWKYDVTETYVCIAQKVSADNERARKVYRVTTVSEVPGVGEQCWGEGHTIESACTELRFTLANAYTAKGVVRDYDEARLRASKVELIVERSLAFGTKGVR